MSWSILFSFCQSYDYFAEITILKGYMNSITDLLNLEDSDIIISDILQFNFQNNRNPLATGRELKELVQKYKLYKRFWISIKYPIQKKYNTS